MTFETISREQYLLERATIDRAEATLHALWPDWAKGGIVPPEVAAAYAPVDNALRGRVDQYELVHNTPERFVAYVGEEVTGAPGRHYLTTWTGLPLGYVHLGRGWRVDSWIGSRMYQAHARVSGRDFTGRTFGEGMSVVLRETAASKRKRQESE